MKNTKETHAAANKEEVSKIVFQKNKEIGELFNSKSLLEREIEELKEEQEIHEMVADENRQLKERVLQMTEEKGVLDQSLGQKN